MDNTFIPSIEQRATRTMTPVHFPGELQLQHYKPHPALQACVECYWVFAHQSTDKTIAARLYPDGGCSLNFHFSRAGSGSWFSRTQTLRQMWLPSDTDVFGVRFYPGGAFALLGLSMQDLSDQIYAADELELSLDAIHFRLQDVPPMQRRHLVDSWLLGRLEHRSARVGLVQKLWPHLMRGEHSVDYYLKDTGRGRRHLERQFQQQVGTSPTRLRILHRIKQARTLIKIQEESSLTEIAQQCGFYDQAHFIRQFQAITRVTPGQYRRRHQSQKRLTLDGPEHSPR